MTPTPADWIARRIDEVRRRCFAPSGDDRRVGVEAELLVYDDDTNRPLLLVGERRSLVGLLRRSSAQLGWTETPGYGDVPKFATADGAVVSFEPGGQLEISSAVHSGGSAAAARLQQIVGQVRHALSHDGVRLDSVGIDPFNDATSIPQQLPAERYRRMTEYFEGIGPFGIRMMRQTAAIQVSVDRGEAPAARWQLLNDLAPYVTAIFANSPRYLEQETGHRSYRAHCWRMLDVTRTGMFQRDDDPASAYTRFALDARDILRTDGDGAHHPFGDWAIDAKTDARWEDHLTTLFPEVRPRGHFEVRSCDAIDAEWYVVPILLICGLVYDDRSSSEAAVLAGDSAALLRRAGEQGLRDASIARTARDLFQLALQGASRLGAGFFTAADIEQCRAYYDRYTARDRSPADDARPMRAPSAKDRAADRTDPSLRSG